MLQHLTEDLQDLALAEEGVVTMHPYMINPAALIELAVEAHRGDAWATGVQLVCAQTRDEGEVWADPIRLRQAVSNLISNAIRHTAAGGTVTVASRLDHTNLELSVTDDGQGMSPDTLDHVFERFWRADPSRTRATGGSGLGLAITMAIARAHGGTVVASSELGVGSTFIVRIPARNGPPAGD